MGKNMLKTLIVVALYIAVSCNLTVFATFEDINNHWAEATINEFVEKEYIKKGESTFNPDEEITKGELTSIINCYFDYGQKESVEENLKLAEEKGYLFNSESGEKITREEVAILICKILALEPVEETDTEFMDSEQISIWAKGYVYALTKEKIIIGYPDMTYKPLKNITKAEFVTVLNRCTGIGGNDLEIIDSEIENIEIGILKYENEKTFIIPITEVIEMESGEQINLALMLPEDVNEENIKIEITNNEIISLDEETYNLIALKLGNTEISFKSEDEKYQTMFEIKVN